MTKESLVQAALAIRDPHERSAFLDQACAGQGELRRAIEALLVAPGLVDSSAEGNQDASAPHVRVAAKRTQIQACRPRREVPQTNS